MAQQHVDDAMSTEDDLVHAASDYAYKRGSLSEYLDALEAEAKHFGYSDSFLNLIVRVREQQRMYTERPILIIKPKETVMTKRITDDPLRQGRFYTVQITPMGDGTEKTNATVRVCNGPKGCGALVDDDPDFLAAHDDFHDRIEPKESETAANPEASINRDPYIEAPAFVLQKNALKVRLIAAILDTE